MPSEQRNNLPKEERIYGRDAIERLFGNTDSRSLVAYPLRVVYVLTEKEESTEQNTPVRILVSVSKKHFKRAVKRNRVKRQIREAYRTRKHELEEVVTRIDGKTLSAAFIWLADELQPTSTVEDRMGKLLQRLAEKIKRKSITPLA